jgi:hypothetical protein
MTDFKITRRLAEYNDGEAKELHYRSFGDYNGPWQLDLGTWICLTSWGLGIEFEVEIGGGWTQDFDVRRQLVLNLGPLAVTAQYYRRPADWSWNSKYRKGAA